MDNTIEEIKAENVQQVDPPHITSEATQTTSQPNIVIDNQFFAQMSQMFQMFSLVQQQQPYPQPSPKHPEIIKNMVTSATNTTLFSSNQVEVDMKPNVITVGTNTSLMFPKATSLSTSPSDKEESNNQHSPQGSQDQIKNASPSQNQHDSQNTNTPIINNPPYKNDNSYDNIFINQVSPDDLTASMIFKPSTNATPKNNNTFKTWLDDESNYVPFYQYEHDESLGVGVEMSLRPDISEEVKKEKVPYGGLVGEEIVYDHTKYTDENEEYYEIIKGLTEDNVDGKFILEGDGSDEEDEDILFTDHGETAQESIWYDEEQVGYMRKYGLL